MSDMQLHQRQIEIAIVRLALIAMGVVLLLFASTAIAVFPPVGLFAIVIGMAGVRLIASGLIDKWPTNGGWVSWMVWRLVIVLILFGALVRTSEKKLQEETER